MAVDITELRYGNDVPGLMTHRFYLTRPTPFQANIFYLIE